MTTVYNTWNECSESFIVTFASHGYEASAADDGHICRGYGKLIASLPFRLGRSLG